MRALFAVLALATGCHLVSGLDTFELDDNAGGGGSGGLSGTGGDGGGATGAGGAGLNLVDRGVLARWFLDEPAGALAVADAIAPAVDLSVERSGGFPELTGAPGVRGVTWASAGTDGFVRTLIEGSKLESLEGKRQATIEAVMSLTEVFKDQTRLVHFGAGSESGRFSLRAGDIGTLELWVALQPRLRWAVDLTTPRLVIHLVYNANAPRPPNRAKLYVGGSFVTPVNVDQPITQYLALDLISADPNTVTFHIGNRDDSSPEDGRSAAGTYHYVALYEVALTAQEVAANAAALALRDDP